MRQADEEVTRPPKTEADQLSTADNSQAMLQRRQRRAKSRRVDWCQRRTGKPLILAG